MSAWSESPCGGYRLDDGPFYVVLTFSDGWSVFAQGDSADIIRQEWDDCSNAGDFSFFEEYRHVADPPEVSA